MSLDFLRVLRPGLLLGAAVIGSLPIAAFTVVPSAPPTMPDGAVSSTSPQWRQLPSYPQSLGVAGILAGQHDDVLIAAGGANFPGKPPWEGGKKIYYDDIFVLRPGASEWQAAGRLPEARGYSAVVSTAKGVLVIGGENATRTFSNCLLLRWTGDRVVIDYAAELPAPLTSPVAAVLAGKIYLAGGYGPAAPRESTDTFLALDLSAEKSGWQSLPSWPGPRRAQAVMAAVDDAVYLMSGLELKSGGSAGSLPHYLTDAFRYRPGSGWEKLPDLPCSVVAAPSPAPTTASPARVFVLGGVDGRQVGKLPRGARLPNSILCFDVTSHQWQRLPDVWPDPVVTVPAVSWNGGWTIVSGEIMAGVRTPNTWEWKIPREIAPSTIISSP